MNDTNPNAQAPELVSMFVMAYNQQDFIEEAVRGAFAQTYSPLEIVLSDDGSTDDTFAIMERMAAEYDGPHQVRLNRNPRNLGFIGHLNKVFEMCRGALIVYNPGDDISEPDRVGTLYDAFRESRPLLVHSDVVNMDADGTLNGLLTSRHAAIEEMDLEETALAMSLGIGATCAWNPDIHRLFGPIRYDTTYDDLVFFFRARLLDRLAYVPRPLVKYRYGVGISNTCERDWRGRIRFERRQHALAADTYRQRMLDCRAVAPERTDILDALQKDLDRNDFKRQLYDAPLRALPRCLVSWRRFKEALSILNRLRKLTFRARREEQKMAALIARSDRTVVRRVGSETVHQ